MKLSQIHEAWYDDDYDDSNPEFDEYVKQVISSDYTPLEQVAEGGYIPLDPTDYDASKASQEAIDDWYNILVVNDTNIEDYAEALNRAQTPMYDFLINNSEKYVTNDTAAELKKIADQLGDRFTISQLAAANQQWLAAVSGSVYSYDDIANDKDVGSSYADDRDERADPYGFRGVRRSDFM